MAGKPFYEDRAETPADIEEDSEAVTVLNECDMNQYKTLVGEWVSTVFIIIESRFIFYTIFFIICLLISPSYS